MDICLTKCVDLYIKILNFSTKNFFLSLKIVSLKKKHWLVQTLSISDKRRLYRSIWRSIPLDDLTFLPLPMGNLTDC